MSGDPLKKLRKLQEHVAPQRVPALVETLQEIGLNTNTVKALLRAHQLHKDVLKRQLEMVPDVVEKIASKQDTVEGVRTIRNSVKGLGLGDALLFHRYFRHGLIPWFLE